LEITVLTERQKAILEICAEGEIPAEIAKYAGVAQPSIYAELRQLEQLGLLKKSGERLAGKNGKQPAIYLTVGTEVIPENEREIEYDPTLNAEFIKHSHNIFARAA
jgi:hypothetical protein